MVQIIRGGCNAHHSGSFFMSRPKGLDFYVILMIHTAVEFQMEERVILAEPGQAVVVSPGTPYQYHNPKGDYIDDWLHFQVTDSVFANKIERIANELIPIENTEFYTNLVKQILWEDAYAGEGYKESSIDACFTLMLNHLLNAYESRNDKREVLPYQEQLKALRLQLQSAGVKKTSIRECAKGLGISDTYFQHLYTKTFGVSFQKDLIGMRISHAKYLLLSTDMTLEQVAELCGYTSEVHFYRQFKQMVHMTPAKYRGRGENKN